MAEFQNAFEEVIKIEGGYSDHPYDRGGKTMYGITEKVARINGYDGKMKDMELEIAQKIYKERYWDLLKLDQVESQAVAEELFDTSVNMGHLTATKFIQQTLNLLNRNQKNYSDLTVDGIFGKITLNTLNSLLPKDEVSILKCLNGFQFERYKDIMIRDPRQEVFARGWLKRVIMIEKPKKFKFPKKKQNSQLSIFIRRIDRIVV